MASLRNRKLSFHPIVDEGDCSSPSPPPEDTQDLRMLVDSLQVAENGDKVSRCLRKPGVPEKVTFKEKSTLCDKWITPLWYTLHDTTETT